MVGLGPGLFHVYDQGCHIVGMFDAKGDDGGAGLGHCHLGEERPREEWAAWPHPGSALTACSC